MTILHEFYHAIDTETERLASNIQSDSNDVGMLFDAPVILTDEPNRPSALIGKKGVYLFFLTKDIHLTYEQVRAWSNSCSGAGFSVWEEKTLHAGQCLYVGSCISVSLYTRIRQHFAAEGTISSLKLKSKNRKILSNIVKVYAYPLLPQFSDPYNRIILPAVEKALHKKYHPIVGSSRV